ncbi:hypothetical protein LTR86_004089 [Recurvomyces mirabilis]|nr:hypothetical protein LTR86_004089 [Recurvomyces mirabilis]
MSKDNILIAVLDHRATTTRHFGPKSLVSAPHDYGFTLPGTSNKLADADNDTPHADQRGDCSLPQGQLSAIGEQCITPELHDATYSSTSDRSDSSVDTLPDVRSLQRRLNLLLSLTAETVDLPAEQARDDARPGSSASSVELHTTTPRAILQSKDDLPPCYTQASKIAANSPLHVDSLHTKIHRVVNGTDDTPGTSAGVSQHARPRMNSTPETNPQRNAGGKRRVDRLSNQEEASETDASSEDGDRGKRPRRSKDPEARCRPQGLQCPFYVGAPHEYRHHETSYAFISKLL